VCGAKLAEAQSVLAEPRVAAERGAAVRIAHVAEPVLAGLGYWLVRAKLSAQAGMTVQIMAERPDGSMTIKDCERASEALSPVLDVEDLLKGAYRLEVSSPGIDRPLVRMSDFRRAVGREARIEMSSGVGGRKRFRGRIVAVEGDGQTAQLILERSDAKPGETGQAALPLCDVAEAKLVLNEELLRQTLRASKAHLARDRARQVEPPSSVPERNMGREPRRGPGRFARRAIEAPSALPGPAGLGVKQHRARLRMPSTPKQTAAGASWTGDEDGSKRE
jgi:ribosome maturation factor RimP